MPINRTPQYDALEYVLWAQQIAAGNFAWPRHPPHGPMYPWFLGAMLFFGSGSLLFVRIAQSLAGALTCFVSGVIARRLFGGLAGVVTAALLAIHGPLVWLDVSIAAEGLLMFLIALTLWSAVAQRHPILIGVLAGLCALTRPTALFIFPLLLWIGAQTTKPRIWIAAATIAVIVPVTIANWRASHAFIPIQAFGGMNVYLGNSPLRDGAASARPGGDWEAIEAEAVRSGAATLAEEDSYFTRKTAREIAEHPFAFVRLLARKTLLTLQNEEVRDTHSFYFFQESVRILRWLPGFTFLFAVAVAGAVAANWRERSVHIVALYTALAAFSSILLVVGARYRIPLVLGLALFGGATILASRRRLIIAAAVAVVAAACSRIERVPATHNFAEEWAMTAQSLLSEGKDAEAMEAVDRASKIDPFNAMAWDTRGSLFAAAGRRAEAVSAFRRAILLNSEYATAHLHLAMLLAETGDLRGAAAEYRRVIAINPRRAEALSALARLDGALGNAEEGLQMAQRAAALRTPGDEDWLIIAMLAADTGRFDAAENALDRISEPSPKVEAVREAIRNAKARGASR